MDGLKIGPIAGSCGTAAYRRHEVLVTDIAHDPLWAEYKDLALAIGLRACWSSPIKDVTGEVIATFAFYWRECRGPDELERRIVETCIDVLSIAIRHDRARSEIFDLAFRDRLTGLANRTSFEAFAAMAIAGSGEGMVVGIHYLDLDDFKTVNDTLGHRVGDQLLAATARRIEAAVPSGSMVSRLGGDEFAICATTATAAEQEDVAAALLQSLKAPIIVDGHELTVGASVGVACSPEHGEDLDRLSQGADMALYAAKGAGRGTYRVFSCEMASAVEERALLKADLSHAAERGELTLVYQPIVEIGSGRVKGFEALLRWTHPQRGPIRPTASFRWPRKPGPSRRSASSCSRAPSPTSPAGRATSASPSTSRPSSWRTAPSPRRSPVSSPRRASRPSASSSR